MGVVIWYGTLVDIDSKARILTVCIGSTNFHSFDVSSYHQMLLDPLNVGLSKTCEENLVIAFSWVFFSSMMNMTSFSVCKLALDVSFNKLTGNMILVFHIFKGKISLLSTEKHERYMT